MDLHENGRGFTFEFQKWFFGDLSIQDQLVVVIPLIIASVVGLWLFASWLKDHKRSDVLALGGLVGGPGALVLMFIAGHVLVQLAKG